MTKLTRTACDCSKIGPLRIAGLIIAGSALATQSLTALAAGRSADLLSAPRTDGVYAFTPVSGKSAPSTYAVRFYADGIAVETNIQGDLKQLAKSLHRDNPTLFPARWSLENGRLVLKRSEGFRETNREGKLSGKGWEISDKVTFAFTPMALAPQKAAPANRRPMFVGVGKGVKEFEYDSAGRPSGHSWLLDVQVADPDGDPVRVSWKTQSGKVIGDGLKVRWKPAGRETVFITLDDGRGGTTVASESLD